MSTPSLAISLRSSRPIRNLLWRYPEWWTYSLCFIGWWALAHHAINGTVDGAHHSQSFFGELSHWLFMVYAMMIPVAAWDLRAAAFASPWSRRHRAITGVLIGYSGVWLLAGIPVALARTEHYLHASAVPMTVFGFAAVWQFVPFRAFAFGACHRVPIPAPRGWAADRDCLVYGIDIGMPCVLCGWPLMAACAFTGHAFVVMIGCTLLTIAERRSFRPRHSLPALGAAALSAYYAFLTFS